MNKQLITVLICLCLLSTKTEAQQLLSWQQKVEIVNAPETMTPGIFYQLFLANGFQPHEYFDAGGKRMANTLTNENGKWYVIGNKHHWRRIITKSDGNLSVDMKKNQLIFKNRISQEKLNQEISKTKATKKEEIRSQQAGEESRALQLARSKVREEYLLVELDGIVGDFDKQKLGVLFSQNDIPRTRYAAFPGIGNIQRSLQSIDNKWFVIVHEEDAEMFETNNKYIRIKNGKMTFAKMP
jgi:hypothetical protein